LIWHGALRSEGADSQAEYRRGAKTPRPPGPHGLTTIHSIGPHVKRSKPSSLRRSHSLRAPSCLLHEP
jgi:hypothetical protein